MPWELMARHSMLPNIVEHSFQVMCVSLAITDNLKEGVSVNRDLVIAGSLLHDITKTRSCRQRNVHDASGGTLLRELGFPNIAEMVEQHVIIHDLNLDGDIEEKEIVYYADKRVMHDTIVTLEEKSTGPDTTIRAQKKRHSELIHRKTGNKCLQLSGRSPAS